MLSNQRKNQHLLWRAAFGPAANQLSILKDTNPKQLYKSLEEASAQKPGYLDTADDYIKNLMQGLPDGMGLNKKEMDKDQRKMLQEKERDSIKNLNLAWGNQMVNSNAQLREKMAFFWHGHFASRNVNIFYQQNLLNVIRQN